MKEQEVYDIDEVLDDLKEDGLRLQNYNDAVGYIDFTTKPTLTAGTYATRVTGKTVSVFP